MDKRENDRFQMYKSIEEFLQANETVTKNIPGFQNSMSDFKESLVDIAKKDNQYQIIAEGSTADKETAEDEMIDVLVKLCSLIYVFARRTKNEQLKAISKVTPSGLKYMRDADLLQRAKAIHEAMEENKVAMEPYQITQEHMDDLKAKIDVYEKKSNVKENKFAEKKNARQELGAGFVEANDILIEEIDTLVEYIKDAHAEFYGEYQAARLINNV